MTKIYINILTNKSLDKLGYEILQILCNLSPDLVPDYYGNWEPLKNKFDSKKIDTILDSWKIFPFLWKKKEPKSNGSVWLSSPVKNEHHCLIISLDLKKIGFNNIQSLFDNWCNILIPDFACITLLTENEIKNGRISGVVEALDKKQTNFDFLIVSNQIKKSIPDIYWQTVFGPSYISYFGKEKLLATPAYSVKELNDNSIRVQLSESIEDLDNVPLIEKSRVEIKKYLGENSFFNTEKGIEGEYKTPWNSDNIS